MHPTEFREFERICKERKARGSVLEIGAVPSEDSLLCLDALKNAGKKIGINLEGPSSYRDFEILKVDGNDMGCFENDMFDTVVSNATLEHDRRFWKTLAEMRRVTRSGGLIIIGVPGFIKLPLEKRVARAKSWPVLGRWLSRRFSGAFASTLILQIHLYPGDYYRFSPQAVREVFLEGLVDIDIRTLMIPPRIIGSGIKP